MKKEKIRESIKKYSMSLIVKDGQEMVKVCRPSKSAKLNEELKKAKPEIVTELKRQQEEWKAKREAARIENEKETQQYIETADLRRCLVEFQDEFFHTEHYIATLHFTDKSETWNDGKLRAYQPEYGGAEAYRRVSLDHITDTMNVVSAGGAVPYGISGVAWEITPEQEAQIVAEQIPAAEKAEQEAKEAAELKAAQEAEKEAKEKAELQSKFDEAKVTGKPVVIRSYMVPCSDPREECSADNLIEYAMPDGTIEKKQYHTW